MKKCINCKLDKEITDKINDNYSKIIKDYIKEEYINKLRIEL